MEHFTPEQMDAVLEKAADRLYAEMRPQLMTRSTDRRRQAEVDKAAGVVNIADVRRGRRGGGAGSGVRKAG